MIPQGLAAAFVAWATSPELTTEQSATRKTALVTERDAVMTGALNSGKGLREMQSGSQNGKSFTVLNTLTATEKLTVLNDALERLGMASADGTPTTTTHAIFPNLQR